MVIQAIHERLVAFIPGAAGCLQGEFKAGLLSGQGQYDQCNYHFEGGFVKGLPSGEQRLLSTGLRKCLLHVPCRS
jgi:hypothetical protein